jgi:hypothetical protein
MQTHQSCLTTDRLCIEYNDVELNKPIKVYWPVGLVPEAYDMSKLKILIYQSDLLKTPQADPCNIAGLNALNTWTPLTISGQNPDFPLLMSTSISIPASREILSAISSENNFFLQIKSLDNLLCSIGPYSITKPFTSFKLKLPSNSAVGRNGDLVTGVNTGTGSAVGSNGDLVTGVNTGTGSAAGSNGDLIAGVNIGAGSTNTGAGTTNTGAGSTPTDNTNSNGSADSSSWKDKTDLQIGLGVGLGLLALLIILIAGILRRKVKSNEQKIKETQLRDDISKLSVALGKEFHMSSDNLIPESSVQAPPDRHDIVVVENILGSVDEEEESPSVRKEYYEVIDL